MDIEWPEGEKTLVLVVDDGGDNYTYDHGDWINPTLVLRNGTEVALTGTYKTRQYTKSYFNRATASPLLRREGTELRSIPTRKR